MFRTLITAAFAASIAFTSALAAGKKAETQVSQSQEEATFVPDTPSLLDRAVGTLEKHDRLGRDPLHPTYRELSQTGGQLDRQVKREQRLLGGY